MINPACAIRCLFLLATVSGVALCFGEDGARIIAQIPANHEGEGDYFAFSIVDQHGDVPVGIDISVVATFKGDEGELSTSTESKTWRIGAGDEGQFFIHRSDLVNYKIVVNGAGIRRYHTVKQRGDIGTWEQKVVVWREPQGGALVGTPREAAFTLVKGGQLGLSFSRMGLELRAEDGLDGAHLLFTQDASGDGDDGIMEELRPLHRGQGKGVSIKLSDQISVYRPPRELFHYWRGVPSVIQQFEESAEVETYLGPVDDLLLMIVVPGSSDLEDGVELYVKLSIQTEVDTSPNGKMSVRLRYFSVTDPQQVHDDEFVW